MTFKCSSCGAEVVIDTRWKHTSEMSLV
jgi:DNA-directed RNA polymerase subunit RPC12/RpoP